MTKIPHPHAHLIKAWADGAQIQYFNEKLHEWISTTDPGWAINGKYRIAPEPKKYRVGIWKNGDFLFMVTNNENAESVERSANFSRWLTPWTEYTPDDPQAHPQDYPVPPGHVRAAPVDPPAQG